MSRLQDELERLLIEYTHDPFDILSTKCTYHDNNLDIAIVFLVNGSEVEYRFPTIGAQFSEIKHTAKRAVKILERD